MTRANAPEMRLDGASSAQTIKQLGLTHDNRHAGSSSLRIRSRRSVPGLDLADDLVQLATVFARAVGHYLVERTAVLVTNGELAVGHALDTGAGKCERGVAAGAPEDL